MGANTEAGIHIPAKAGIQEQQTPQPIAKKPIRNKIRHSSASGNDGWGSLECVSQLRAVEYTRKEIPEPTFEKDADGNPIYPEVMPEAGQKASSKKEMGFIAQEVEKVCPELVQTSEYAEGYKSVDYMRMNALLVKAIQQLTEKNKAQDQQISELRSLVESK